MPELYLQSVIVKKPMLLGLARKKAKAIIQTKHRRFVRETNEHYIFRNLPEKNFNPEKLIIKKISDTVSIIYGEFIESNTSSTPGDKGDPETPGQKHDMQDMRGQSTQEEFQVTPINDTTPKEESVVQGLSDNLHPE
jgi:hypothetical protein